MAVIRQNKWIWAYAASVLCYIGGIAGIVANAPYNPFPLALWLTVRNILEQSAVFVLLIAVSFLIVGVTTMYLTAQKIMGKRIIRGIEQP